MVRDIRENKGKLQTPIHQVRDVRKLVKSSYHFVSLDNNENRSAADSHTEQKKLMPYRNLNSVSPIVIKCQSVNTNSNGKQDISKGELLDFDRSSPEGAVLQKAAGRVPIDNPNNSSEGGSGLRIESNMASKRQEKPSDITDKKPESKVANQAAFDKLQAAVKTMEQLYVFERNEWKRKNKPRPLTDSHVLSLLTSEDHEGLEEEEVRGFNMDRAARRDSYPNADKTPPAVAASPSLPRRDDKVFQTPKSMQTTTNATGHKNMFSLSSNLKPSASTRTTQPPNAATQTPFNTRSFTPKSPKLPVSLKSSQTKRSGQEGVETREVERSLQDLWGADNENYLTIPVKSPANTKKPAPSVGSTTRGHEEYNQSPKRASIVMEPRPPEIPPATIYHSLPLGMNANQPQLYCFSPAITPAPTLDPFQATQRKMLLDPTTGNYYLVDTPVQPTTKRLFDPETGQYVDVPMPQPPMTPVPMPISPLALSPGAYGHTYMIYPGFMPTPSVIPARTLVQSQMSMQSEAESVEKASSPTQGFSTATQPVISITSQQGPRIIAPPSFDGTTMSFVVEHR
uniref:DUF4585 domain-containing protein n=1 Tax=Labrus bergylta TaxID=56723 RepID=A0A3Q3FDM0_9LABR